MFFTSNNFVKLGSMEHIDASIQLGIVIRLSASTTIPLGHFIPTFHTNINNEYNRMKESGKQG